MPRWSECWAKYSADAELVLERPGTFAGDGELGAGGQADLRAVGGRVELGDRGEPDERRAVDAEEAGGGVAVLEVGDARLDDVAAVGGDGVGQLVLGGEVRDAVELDEVDPVAEARRDALGVACA